MLAESDRPGGLIGRRPVQQHFERLLVSSLLLAQTHNYTETLLRPQPPAYPRTVRRAVDLIDAQPETICDWVRVWQAKPGVPKRQMFGRTNFALLRQPQLSPAPVRTL